MNFLLDAAGWTVDPQSLPAAPGAYLLVVDLARPLKLDVATLGTAELPPGRYAYAGSARGPGGIRARVARHFRAGKKHHWHIDRLTGAAETIRARALPGGSECAIVAALLARHGATVPVAGFGSSDCAACPAHLLALS